MSLAVETGKAMVRRLKELPCASACIFHEPSDNDTNEQSHDRWALRCQRRPANLAMGRVKRAQITITWSLRRSLSHHTGGLTSRQRETSLLRAHPFILPSLALPSRLGLGGHGTMDMNINDAYAPSLLLWDDGRLTHRRLCK
jgi:hypothetical protein